MRSRLAVGSLVLSLAAVAGCSGPDAEPIPRVTQPTDLPSQPTPTDTPTDGEPDSGTPSEAPGGPPEVVDTFVDGLEVPWGIDFLPTATPWSPSATPAACCRVGTDARGDARSARVDERAPQGEAGLLGVAVSPSYAETDRTLFFYVSTDDDNRVVTADVRRRPARRTDADPRPASRTASSTTAAGCLRPGRHASTSPPARPATPSWPRTATRSAGKILPDHPDGQARPRQPRPRLAGLDDGPPQRAGPGLRRRGPALGLGVRRQDACDELNLIEKGAQLRLAAWSRARAASAGATRPAGAPGRPTTPRRPGSPSLDGRLWMAGAARRAAVAGRRLGRRHGAGSRGRSSSATTAGCAPSSPPPTATCG